MCLQIQLETKTISYLSPSPPKEQPQPLNLQELDYITTDQDKNPTETINSEMGSKENTFNLNNPNGNLGERRLKEEQNTAQNKKKRASESQNRDQTTLKQRSDQLIK